MRVAVRGRCDITYPQNIKYYVIPPIDVLYRQNMVNMFCLLPQCIAYKMHFGNDIPTT